MLTSLPVVDDTDDTNRYSELLGKPCFLEVNRDWNIER